MAKKKTKTPKPKSIGEPSGVTFYRNDWSKWSMLGLVDDVPHMVIFGKNGRGRFIASEVDGMVTAMFRAPNGDCVGLVQHEDGSLSPIYRKAS